MQNKMEIKWNWNRTGMEINGDPAVEVKFNGVERKQKGYGMKKIRRTVILTFGFGNGLEWKWKRKWNSPLFV